MGSIYEKIKTLLSSSISKDMEMEHLQSEEVSNNIAEDGQVYLTALDTPDDLKPVSVDIRLTPRIPVGFKWDENSTIDIDVSLDTSTIKIAKEEIFKDLLITFEDEGTSHSINCEVPIAKIYILGTIFSNVVVSGFEPIDQLVIADQSTNFTYTRETGFSQTNTVVLNQLSGYGCNYEDITQRNYDVVITMGQPYIVLDNQQIVKLQPVVTTQELAIQELNTLHASYIGNEALNGSQSYDMFVPAEVSVRVLNPGS